DARRLPFDDATFDVILSLNVLHNIARRDEREQALKEIVRVLKPGGQLRIADFRNVGEYARFLRENGIRDAQTQRIGWVALFPMAAAIGRKPLALLAFAWEFIDSSSQLRRHLPGPLGGTAHEVENGLELLLGVILQ